MGEGLLDSVLVREEIYYTEFRLDEVRLYLAGNGSYLRSEH